MNERPQPQFGGPTEGPLTSFNGAVPPAPQWFERIAAIAPESCFVEVEGAKIHFLRWGDRSKPGLLLVHGNAAHAYWWSFIARQIGRDEAPPISMRRVAVNQQKTGLRTVAPAQKMNLRAFDFDEAAFRRDGGYALEPLRRRRHGPVKGRERAFGRAAKLRLRALVHRINAAVGACPAS